MATAQNLSPQSSPVPSTEPVQHMLRQQLEQRRQRLQEALAHGARVELQRLLGEVDAALTRMDTGVFGICEECRDSIEVERIITDPLTCFCLDHLPPQQQRQLERDLELAAQIQARLLPRHDLRVDGWRAAYHYKPVGVVSGDYCDVVVGPDNSLYFIVGDVVGKGVAASLLMANLSAMFRALIPLGVPLSQLMQRANRVFCESTLPTQFATLICGRAQSDGAVEICNAGHVPALVVRGGEVLTLDSGALPVGLFCEQDFPTANVQLNQGDSVVLLTDGISEARNRHDEEYGTTRLCELLRDAGQADAGALVETCVNDLVSFRTATLDDETLMVVQRAGS